MKKSIGESDRGLSMKNILKNTIQSAFCFFMIMPAIVYGKTSDASDAKGLSPYVFFVGFILILVAFCLIKWFAKSRFERNLNELYETLTGEQRNELFAADKRFFYFIGKMLQQVFPKENIHVLVQMYIDLHEMYTALGEDVYKSFTYAKEKFTNLKEDAVFSLLAVVMLNVEGIQQMEDCSAERIAPFKRSAQEQIQSVEIVSQHTDIFGIKADKQLGERDNAILVAGPNGIKSYLESIVGEDGTSIGYVHKGTAYINDSNLGIKYDLRKYSLRDAATNIEICSVWFNPYGKDNSKECIAGFEFKDNTDSIPDAKTAIAANELSIPGDVVVSCDSASGKPRIAWSEVDGANKYFVYKSMSADGTYTYQGSSSGLDYIHLNAEPGKCYYYKVKAADTTKKSVMSACSDVCTITCALPRPIVTASNDTKTGKVRLTWDAVAGAVKYAMYRSKSEEGPFKEIYSHKPTTYVNTGGVEVGVTYYYKVRAIHNNSHANSALSETVWGSWIVQNTEKESV